MKRILVTGASGQLATCIRDAASEFPNFMMVFQDRSGLDITKYAEVEAYFKTHDFDYCINTAAYTNVEEAEKQSDVAFSVNADGARNVADACNEHDVTMIHISTDYVFDGKKGSPYRESDATAPINIYGASKLQGEEHVRASCPSHYIFRTSWLYSQYGHNFLKSMLRLGAEKKELTITTEQTGCPTNANDLAKAILLTIDSNDHGYGTYHYSNEGEATWFDFAKSIFETTGQIDKILLNKTDHYPTFAQRPVYSVLNCEKIQNALSIKMVDWKDALQTVLQVL
ncbi:dTDP-4-dehydrorhamnose reductase [Luteirhabdus pelagi]|jgi:dTDP-4-dehydrorhamnose reductase|uniref:dTDP-4-dehydrorhamnose reductase n=1 Tax=Luteirhabdus pelagi TaxID=2792783 RepID=UPI00193AD1C0|nr:dTDP-4-dehydrorhamnose reductase [Luteirhabdus pelagi]